MNDIKKEPEKIKNDSVEDLNNDDEIKELKANSEEIKEIDSSKIKNKKLSEDINLILDIPIKMTIELGRTKMTIRDLLLLKRDSIVTLDGEIGEPLDILINDYLVARGEVVVMKERYGIKILDIITPEERIRRLNR
ncbi:fliN [Wigglesworthia glossinidia endosymbiont of Glossina brevipalpis]|uniref:Flagellar motor switch protein FliN n=1 Tax=Wigglesworthia glossinidia brevipalpis TaxID=36870 RepID=Q8D3E9_WIGBR|nr:fliN [Wigglesworthia glossinidia endosymbiont of Glossina brevipalpis]